MFLYFILHNFEHNFNINFLNIYVTIYLRFVYVKNSNNCYFSNLVL